MSEQFSLTDHPVHYLNPMVDLSKIKRVAFDMDGTIYKGGTLFPYTKDVFETLEKIENGTLEREKQNDSLSTYASMLSKEEIMIGWNLSAQNVHNKVRGMNPWPVAAALFGGKKLKIFKTRITSQEGSPSEVLSVSPPVVACGENSVELVEVQLEGKKRMSAADFFRGQRINVGDRIG